MREVVSVSTKQLHHVMQKMLQAGNLTGASRLIPNMTLQQAVALRDGELVFEGDAVSGFVLKRLNNDTSPDCEGSVDLRTLMETVNVVQCEQG